MLAECSCDAHREQVTNQHCLTVSSQDGANRKICYYLHSKTTPTVDKPDVLVLIHGLKSSARSFDGVIAPLTESFDILTFDQRGHGYSDEDPDGIYTLSAMAGDLNLLIDHFQITHGSSGPVHLLGSSFGARTALAYFEIYPDRVKSLVLEDMALGRGSSGRVESVDAVFRKAKAVKSLYRETFASADEARDTLQKIYGSPTGDNSEDSVYWSSKMISNEGSDSVKLSFRPHVATLYAYFAQTAELDECLLKDSKTPVLVMRADKQHSAISEKEWKWLQEIADKGFVKNVVVEGATHNVHKSCPEAFVREVVSFCGR